MDILANLGHGFAVALTAQNFMYCLLGAGLGTLVGVLPGLGYIAAGVGEVLWQGFWR